MYGGGDAEMEGVAGWCDASEDPGDRRAAALSLGEAAAARTGDLEVRLGQHGAWVEGPG